MSYQVFARKYRPQTFDDVLGQDHVIQTLKNAIEQKRLAHAYLFVGPRGTGKTSTARILAKALNCSGGPKTDFDPREEICQEIAEGNSLDVLEIDGASNNGVEQVRELRENVKFAPVKGNYRIYYIDEVHMLTTAAFNALLKTLEEPPEHVKFLFATTEANKILPTILSRCQRFDLRRIPTTIIAKHLLDIAEKETLTLEPSAAHTLAKGAEGGMRDAQSMLDQLVAFCGNQITEKDVLHIFGFSSTEIIASLAETILHQHNGEALEILSQQNEAGKDLSKLLTELIAYFRSLLVYQVSPESVQSEFSEEMLATIERQSAAISSERLLTLLDHLAATSERMKWSPNKKLYLEMGIIKATQTLSEVTLSDVITALGDDNPKNNSAELLQAQTSPSPPPKEHTNTAPQEKTPEQRFSREKLWEKILEALEKKRPLIVHWARAGIFLEERENSLLIGFPKSQSLACQSLAQPNNKAFIENLIRQFAGKDLSIRLELKEDLQEKVAPPVEEIAREEAEENHLSKTPQTPPVAQKKKSTKLDEEELRNDPLIKEALRIFEAELKL